MAATVLATQLVCFKGPYTLVDGEVVPGNLTFSDLGAAGNIFENVRGKTLLLVRSEAAFELTMTFSPTVTVAEGPGNLETVDPTVTISVVGDPGDVKIIGPFTSNFEDAERKITVTYNLGGGAITNFEIAAVKIT